MMGAKFSHRPTLIYLEKAACEYEIKASDETNRFRVMHRIGAQQLRDVIADSKRRAEWNGHRKPRY